MKKYFFTNYSIIIIIKIFVLYIFGAQIMPDSNGYISESKSLFDTMPFRNYGYPIIISTMSFFFSQLGDKINCNTDNYFQYNFLLYF